MHVHVCVCVSQCSPMRVRPRVRASVCSSPPPRVCSSLLITLFYPLPFPLNTPGHSSARHRDAPPPAHGPGPHRVSSHVCPSPVFSAYLWGALPCLGHGLSRAYPGFQSAGLDPGSPPAPEEAGAAGLRPVGSHEALCHCLLSCGSLGPDFPGLRLPNRVVTMPLTDGWSAAKGSGTSWSPCRHRCSYRMSLSESLKARLLWKRRTQAPFKSCRRGRFLPLLSGHGSHAGGFSCVLGRCVDTAGARVTVNC